PPACMEKRPARRLSCGVRRSVAMVRHTLAGKSATRRRGLPMKKYALAATSTLLLFAAFPLGAKDRKGSDSGGEEYVRTLTVVEVKGHLSYPPESKGSHPPAGSVRVGPPGWLRASSTCLPIAARSC